MPEQVAAYSAFVSGQADPNALYVVMIGGNDVRNAALQGTGDSAVEDGATAVGNGVSAELTAISTLAGEGAKHFLVVNVPNVGLIPEFAQDRSERTWLRTPRHLANCTTRSLARDCAPSIRRSPPAQRSPTSTFTISTQTFWLMLAALGFTNTTDPCFTNTPASAAATTACGPNGANVDQFVYWDDIHPTAPVHALWAEGFEAAVPEPSTWAMLLVGFVGLGFAGYRRGARARAAA